MKTLAEVIWKENNLELDETTDEGDNGENVTPQMDKNCLQICCTGCGVPCLTLVICGL